MADEEVQLKAPDNSADSKLSAQGGLALAAASTQPIIDVPSPDAKTSKAPQISMNDAGVFSIQINSDMSIVEVLRMIANQAQLSIVPSREVHGTIPAMDLYNVTASEALDAILHSNGLAWKREGNVIYVYSDKEMQDQQKAARVLTTEMFHLFYTPAANALNMIKPVLSPDAQASATAPPVTGIASSDSEAGGDSHASDDMIVVTDYPENIAKVRQILKEVDHRPQQILVEATIFQANLTENNAMGIDFSLMGGVNFDTLLDNSTSLTTALSGNVLNTTNGTGTGATGTGTGNAASILQKGYAGGTTGNYDTQVPPGGLQIGIVHNNLAVFIQALEQVTNATVLANPKVLALDKQRGEVIVGNQYGYLTTTTTATSSTQTVQFLETGTRLLFRPYVGDDGYIRMEIHPEDSSGGLNSANLPFKITTEVTSNLMVRDGSTIVIGGLFRESSQSNRSQVPVLGNLPLAGALFRSQTDATSRQEIIILLTPHIIKDDSAYGHSSEQELKEAERIRVGVRKGMMWSGRERLAESAYENAVAELHKDHPDTHLAIWHLNCAIDLNPQFIEAIDLKEKLTGQEVTDVDNSRIRGFVRRQILAEEGGVSDDSTPLLPRNLMPDFGDSANHGQVRAAPPDTRPAPLPDKVQPQAVAAGDAPTTQPTAEPNMAAKPVVTGDLEPDDDPIPAGN